MPPFADFPLAFWLCCLVIPAGAAWAWGARKEGWGLPALMVLGTLSVWYVGDVLYNDYAEYQMLIGDRSLESAWWQVLIFLLSFLAMVKYLHQRINGSLIHRRSRMVRYVETRRLERRDVQGRITKAATGLFIAWALLMAVALVQVNGNVIGLFAPYLGQKADPWGRGQIGGGFSALISLAAYLQIFLVAGAGVVVAVARDPKTRTLALMICLLTLPYYVFDRTRNTMLATILPGLLAWIFLRLKGGIPVKLGVLAMAFLVVNFWFTLVMANRSGMSFDIDGALSGKESVGNKSHEGLNMLGELAWTDHFIETGAYLPNWGYRYFAELVNPIPRVIWKNKPMIGLDYAVARGQLATGPNGETTATISTGMIGQGVVNFGRILGPMAAALLMALWCALLARQDLLGDDPGHLLLYGCGMILTFNMGRDITLLVIYPFLFGLLLLKGWRYFQPEHEPGPRREKTVRRPKSAATRSGRRSVPDGNGTTISDDPIKRLPY